MLVCYFGHNCLASHEGPRRVPSFPSRVIDVGSPSAEKVFLVETEGTSARYIALSYCWGKSHRLKAIKANIAELKAGVTLDGLPQTFQDAVKICRRLDVKYLWIDSLCIIQDDRRDWDIEASKMGSVYSNSYLTISALNSRDDSEGCFPSVRQEPEGKEYPFVSPDVLCTGRRCLANAVPYLMPRGSSGSD